MGTSSFMASSPRLRGQLLHEHLDGRRTEDFHHTLEALPVQFPADFPVEAFGGAIDREEPDELLESTQRVLGVADQAQVQPEAAVAADIGPGAAVEVVHDDRRVAAD